MSTALRSSWLRWGLAALIQLLLVALPLADRLSVHYSGVEVTLALRPVDPRDLLRGDYVILNPAIGEVDVSEVGRPENLQAGDRVWTVVEPDADGIFRAVDLLHAPPAAGRVALSGTVRRIAAGGRVLIDYGLDAFFVPEGRGREIERLDTSTLRLVVAVSADGRSAPLRLLADGKVLLQDSAF
ncbi:GDYXXLXY domain-containing protein [Stappia indica]|uniref:GDYXXLXY domain-containing protein n=1 Tax=Stappia indica TaxID=538381 RepID=UPI001CD4D8A0|nr:GDYXXLXY domain-containing protein [Stappia indica]MCA1298472.1 GDYXXLXY domain-containing protein [Stappia indica]